MLGEPWLSEHYYIFQAQHACVNGVNLNHYLIVSQAADLDAGTNRGPFYLNGLTLILRWIILHYTMPEGITYPFPNLNGCTVQVWEWISNFIPHFKWK